MDLRLGPSSRPQIRPSLEQGERRSSTETRAQTAETGAQLGLFESWSERANVWRAQVIEQGPKAEAFAAHWIFRTRPVWRWFALEWRRLGTLAAIVLIAGLLLHAVFGANGMVVYQQKRDELKTLQQDVERVQKENDGYEERIKALKSDPNAIEKEAREQLHYTRPGEMVYVMPEAPQKPPTGRAKNGK